MAKRLSLSGGGRAGERVRLLATTAVVAGAAWKLLVSRAPPIRLSPRGGQMEGERKEWGGRKGIP